MRSRIRLALAVAVAAAAPVAGAVAGIELERSPAPALLGRIDEGSFHSVASHVYFRIYRGTHSWGLWRPHAVEWIGRALTHAAPPTG